MPPVPFFLYPSCSALHRHCQTACVCTACSLPASAQPGRRPPAHALLTYLYTGAPPTPTPSQSLAAFQSASSQTTTTLLIQSTHRREDDSTSARECFRRLFFPQILPTRLYVNFDLGPKPTVAASPQVLISWRSTDFAFRLSTQFPGPCDSSLVRGKYTTGVRSTLADDYSLRLPSGFDFSKPDDDDYDYDDSSRTSSPRTDRLDDTRFPISFIFSLAVCHIHTQPLSLPSSSVH